MFEAAELGRQVSKDVYKDEERELQTDLLVTQRAMRDANVPALIIVAGVEGAGKGEVVNLLHTWLDARVWRPTRSSMKPTRNANGRTTGDSGGGSPRGAGSL